ncbi:hypothetical protein MTO96_010920 [Rhipicephalus appendiculatus]
MHFVAVFAVLAISMAVEAVPSARTFASSQHPEHNVPAHNHDAHQHIFPGVPQNTANQGQQVHVEDDSSVSVLVCQVVKVPTGHPVPQPAPAVPATPPISAGSPSIVVSSQEALSNLTTRVRTAMDSLVEPVVAALQNASLWLNLVPAGVDVASLQFSSPVRNATSFEGSFAEPVAATMQPAPTPAPVSLAGRTG